MLKNCVNCRGTGSWPWSQQPPLCRGDAQHHRAIYLWNPWPPLKASPLQEISDVFSSWQSITEQQPCQLLCSHTCWTSHAWATMFLSSGVHTNLVRTLWSRHLPEMHASMHKLSADNQTISIKCPCPSNSGGKQAHHSTSSILQGSRKTQKFKPFSSLRISTVEY
jgi:hypothetical protein